MTENTELVYYSLHFGSALIKKVKLTKTASSFINKRCRLRCTIDEHNFIVIL